MTYPITPNPAIHQQPKNIGGQNMVFTGGQLQQWAQQLPLAMTLQLIDAILTALGASQSEIAQINTDTTSAYDTVLSWLQPTANNANNSAANWNTFLTDIGLTPTEITQLGEWWNGLWAFLTGTATTQSGLAAISGPQVANTATNAQPVPDFPNSSSVPTGGGWAWDGTTSYSGAGGSVEFTASGNAGGLRGVVCPVQPDQTVTLAAQVQWSGLTVGGSNPIQLQIIPWNGDIPGTPAVVAEIASPGTSASWTVLSGTYDVPSSDVTAVQMYLVVTADAAAGNIWWSACTTTISGGYLANIETLTNQLNSESQASLAATQTFYQSLGTAVTNDAGNLAQFWTDAGNAAQIWWSTESGIAQSEIVTLEQLAEAAFGISSATNWLTPSTNVQGVGGLQTLEDTFTSMWNQGIAAIQNALDSVGLSGFAQSLSGLAAQTNNTQTVALSTAAVQAIVNNQPVAQGLEATVESNGDYHQSTALSSALIAQTTSRGTFVTVNQAKTLGFVQWIGVYSSAPSDFVINFYKMDSSGNLDLLFTSPDLHATLSPTVAWYVWDIPTANQIAVLPGDVIGVEFQVITTGSVEPYGYVAPLSVAHPSAAVKQLGFTQNWAGSAASTISSGSIGWSPSAPYVGLGVGTPPPTPFLPQTTPFYTSGTYVPESWANYTDLIGVGAGGGGEGETGAGNGDGGTGGIWGGVTLTVGTTNTAHPGMDIPTGGTITITIGTGGTGGPYFTPGADGGNTTFSWVNIAGTTKTITCPGGAGGQPSTNLTSWGLSPGNFTYTTQAPSAQTTAYIGGSVNAIGGVGNSPGGGGCGGAAFQFGFQGASGQAWTVDRQS